MRKIPLVKGEYYHIYNRSIAKYQIFTCDEDYHRMIELLDIYRFVDFPCKYSHFLGLSLPYRKAILDNLAKTSDLLVEIVGYCLMPTHPHLILKQVSENGITKYMTKVLDSYTKYFNIKHGRKGPLWEGHFKSVLVLADLQMLYLSCYLHLNPIKAGLVGKPEDWQFSSYLEYLGKTENKLCRFDQVMDINPKIYKKFVHENIAYQKELASIKHLLFDDYAG